MTYHRLVFDEPDLCKEVLAAADRLPFHQAQALWLVDICELNYVSASSALGLSPPEFVGRLHAARRRIRPQLSITPKEGPAP